MVAVPTGTTEGGSHVHLGGFGVVNADADDLGGRPLEAGLVVGHHSPFGLMSASSEA